MIRPQFISQHCCSCDEMLGDLGSSWKNPEPWNVQPHYADWQKAQWDRWLRFIKANPHLRRAGKPTVRCVQEYSPGCHRCKESDHRLLDTNSSLLDHAQNVYVAPGELVSLSQPYVDVDLDGALRAPAKEGLTLVNAGTNKRPVGRFLYRSWQRQSRRTPARTIRWE